MALPKEGGWPLLSDERFVACRVAICQGTACQRRLQPTLVYNNLMGLPTPTAGPTVSSEAVLVPLINQLAELTTPPVLVLDDYHAMTNPAIDQVLVFLSDNALRTLHLVIATRADPSFPLPRWRARCRSLIHLVGIRQKSKTLVRSDGILFLWTWADA